MSQQRRSEANSIAVARFQVATSEIVEVAITGVRRNPALLKQDCHQNSLQDSLNFERKGQERSSQITWVDVLVSDSVWQNTAFEVFP